MGRGTFLSGCDSLGVSGQGLIAKPWVLRACDQVSRLRQQHLDLRGSWLPPSQRCAQQPAARA